MAPITCPCELIAIGCASATYPIADSVSKKVRQIFSVAPQEIWGFALSRDNRSLYYNLAVTDGDIWLAERP